MNLALIITAAGSSTRFGGDTKKEYLPLTIDGVKTTVLGACAEKFLSTKLFCALIVTVPKNDESSARKALEASCAMQEILQGKNKDVVFSFVQGGATRQESVYNGLQALANLQNTCQAPSAAPSNAKCKKIDAVLIHDGARPWVSQELIYRVIDVLKKHGSSVPATSVTDTQKIINKDGVIVEHLERDKIVAVQTPQAFLFAPLLQAHRKAHQVEKTSGKTYTDDTAIWGAYCGDVHIAKGDINNKKITYASDI